jgi:putative membrane protein
MTDVTVDSPTHEVSAETSDSPVRPLQVDPRRVLGAIALGAWAALFWWLIATGRTSLYLSPRTDWVVPVGALVLTTALIGRLASLRRGAIGEVGPRDAWGTALIALPVALVLALPPASLGSFAVSRRSSASAGAFAGSLEDIATGELSLIDISAGLRSREGMRALVKRAGAHVSFVGFVTRREGMDADQFVLTRFLISCCVADALSVQARVVGAPPGGFKTDQWVRVEGNMYPLGREVIVDATSVTRVPKPAHPYLSP